MSRLTRPPVSLLTLPLVSNVALLQIVVGRPTEAQDLVVPPVTLPPVYIQILETYQSIRYQER